MTDRIRPAQLRWALTLIVALLVVTLLYSARTALLPFFLGALLAYVVLPVTDFLSKRMPGSLHQGRLGRALSVVIVYVLGATVLVGATAFIFPPIIKQVNTLILSIPNLDVGVTDLLPEGVRTWWETYSQIVPADIQAAIERGIENTVQSLLRAIQSGLATTISVVFSTVSFVIGLIIVPLWTFFLLRDQPDLTVTFYSLLPDSWEADVQNLFLIVDRALGAYLRGQLILSLSVFAAVSIGLLALGVKYALLLGAIAGILELVPTLGPLIAIIPQVLVVLVVEPGKLLWVILLNLVVQQLENNILVPLVSSSVLGLHPAVVMVLLVVSAQVFGLGGIILAVPLAAITRDILRYAYLRLADDPLSPREAMLRMRPTRTRS